MFLLSVKTNVRVAMTWPNKLEKKTLHPPGSGMSDPSKRPPNTGPCVLPEFVCVVGVLKSIEINCKNKGGRTEVCFPILLQVLFTQLVVITAMLP